MNRNAFLLIAGGLLCVALTASATTRYVNLNNPAPASPYTNWVTAATNIQAAVDVAVAGDEIVVTNGIYATGGRAVFSTMTNRVAIDKAVTVRSANGPLVTVIEGAAVAGTTNGDGAIRCVYVGTSAVLSGFTLTNGHTRKAGSWKEMDGGGAFCEVSGVVSNCTLSGNSASSDGGGACQGTLNNCTLSGNSASWSGGGAYGATLNNCTLSGNSAHSFGGGASYGTLNNCTLSGNSASSAGGGAYEDTLNNCTLSGNSASDYGGGARESTLNNCTLNGNSAQYGGGAYYGTLNNCTLSGNSASYRGGGAYSGTLNNCTLSSNSASDSGGGAYSGTLNNCTLSGNSASSYGGGAFESTLNNCTLSGNSASYRGGGSYYGTLNNCIVYYNSSSSGPNHYSSTFSYSCTTPLPAGPGNIDSEPLLASSSHLSAQSPCIARGSSAYSTGADIDGESWLNPPCMGADQFVAGQATGGLTVAITAAYTNVATGFTVAFVAQISGRITGSAWDFGDGVVVSNRPYASHAWAEPGWYEVRLTGYNESWPGGVSATVLVRVEAREVYYADASNAAPAYPHTNWGSAATNIQAAIDAGTQIGRLVLVADGVYGSGGRAVYGQMTNRVVVPEGVEVRSASGPLVTRIVGLAAAGTTNGSGAIRCVYVGTNAVLSGFTLTNGHTRAAGDTYKEQSGGGVWCEVSGVVNNCTLSGNSASDYGGGASYGTLNNCTLSRNSALYGGGAYSATPNNCTLIRNSADYIGGGAYSGTLNNCIVYYNSAPNNPNYYSSTVNYSCATPLPAGTGNFTNAPLFMDTNGWSNLRLQTNSPCINAGSNAYASGLTDLDGQPRLAGGMVDLGAYELQGTGLSGFTGWLWQYGLRIDGTSDYADTDLDGHNNWQEWCCQTDPTNALSALRLVSASPAGTNLIVTWQSEAGVNYYLLRSTNLWAGPPFRLLATNLVGQAGTTTHTDTNAARLAPLYYRIGVGTYANP